MVMSYFKFLDFDWSGLAYPVGCLAKGYHTRLLMVSLGPFLLIAGIGFVPLSRKCTPCNGVLAHRFVQFDGFLGELRISGSCFWVSLSSVLTGPGSLNPLGVSDRCDLFAC